MMSSALLLAAGMNLAFADTLTLTTSGLSAGTTAGGGYEGVSLKVDADWLTGGESSAYSSLQLNEISVTGRADHSWTSTTAKLVVRVHDTGTVIAISGTATVPAGTGATMTFSNFTDWAGNSGVTLKKDTVYDFSFVTGSTRMQTFTATGGAFVANELATYTNASVGTNDEGYSFVNSKASSGLDTSNVSPTYKAGVSLSGETISSGSSGTGKVLNLYVLTGQSNSLGAVKDSPLSKEMLESHKTSTDTVKYWHENFGQSEGTFDGASTEWEAVAPATPEYNGNLCMGPEYGFAYMIEKKGWKERLCGNDGDLGIVKVSRDGGGNSNWTAGGQAYRLVLQAVANAVAKAKEDGYTTINILGLMYEQGESNTAAEAALAGTRLEQLVEDLKTDFGVVLDDVVISDGYHVVAGENATWHNATEYTEASLTTRDNLYEAVSRLNEDGTTFGEWVPTHDLEKTNVDGSGVHYTGSSQLTIGARYAYVEAFRKGYKEEKYVIRNFDLDAALDSDAAYHSGNNQSATEVVTWDVASSAITKVSENDSTVHLYGIKVDADAGNYLQTGATQIKGVVSAAGTLSAESARLIIGAGGIDIGKNLTLATNLGADASQTWKLAEGATLQLDGSFFAELSAENILSVENISTALITKEGAGKLLLADAAALGLIFDSVSGLAEGKYTFSLFAGFSADELSAFGKNNLTFLSGDGWLADTMSFDASTGTLTISYIPEPSAFGLLAGTAALALAVSSRRRRRAK